MTTKYLHRYKNVVSFRITLVSSFNLCYRMLPKVCTTKVGLQFSVKLGINATIKDSQIFSTLLD